MLARLLVLSVIAMCLSPGSAGAVDTCVSCHAELEEEHLKSPVTGMTVDVHARHGLSCADCHGGNPASEDIDESMDPDAGYVGVPDREDIPEFCGRCHQDAEYMRQYSPGARVDQTELYWTSEHGKRLRAGDQKVATCTSCHSKHGILPPSDPRSSVYATNVPATCSACHADENYMAGYNISTSVMDEYRASVHGEALLGRHARGAPACNDCHGNHGAAPPGVSSVLNVCGQCHPVNSTYFGESPHAAAFEEEELAACETCHGHHDIPKPTDAMVGTSEGSVCVECHEEDTKGYLTAAAVSAALRDLVLKQEEAEELLLRAERAGMEVSEAKFELHSSGEKLTKARATVHTLSLARVEEQTVEGQTLVTSAIASGHQALSDLDYRRKGLGASLILIVAVCAALVKYIRDVDRDRGLR